MDFATICVALLLCTRVRAALPAVQGAANEAAAALALLSPFLDTQNVTVALYGNASWTGDFLSGLPPRTVRVVLRSTKPHREQVRYSHTENVLMLLVAERVADPWALFRQHGEHEGRLLYWFAVQDESVLFTTAVNVPEHIICGYDGGVAVTTPGGRTGLYRINDHKCLTNDDAAPAFKLADRWSPTEQRWQRGGGVFYDFMKFCSVWRPPVPPEPLNLIEVPLTGEKSLAAEILGMKKIKSRKRVWNTTITTIYLTSALSIRKAPYQLKQKLHTCRLDAFFTGVGVLEGRSLRDANFITEKNMYPIVAVVPAGLGAVVSPLSSVTLEFSPAVWYGTALAALGTAAAVACTLRRDRGAALQLALAPLLAQAPPPPPAAGPALRPLLGAWLLVCVVLAAAYQGLLLGMLSSARPRGEIDSLEALADSGLRVDFSAQIPKLGTIYGKKVFKFDIGHYVLDTDRTIYDIAMHRNCALITIEDRYIKRIASRFNIPHKRLHHFSLGYKTHRMVALWSPGSLLGTSLAWTYQRLDEAGVLDRWDNLVDDRDRHTFKPGVLQHAVALTLKHMQPAFLVLVVGYALAALVFVAELLAARWPRGGARPVRRAPADAEVRLILVRPCPSARRSVSTGSTSSIQRAA
ncbi:Ionotropic receptor 93a [Frankliniella fusca]|uniref:Ionotropic receptor 93a n=1 Tax=Frankliniella fusca TaxID=407009 RepID=A0AAE1LL21_9NEOP|nr:Ionotropic receptor 93a [Frankliniella fusca]